MAFGVSMLLKSLGVNITDEDIKKLEILVPQLPAKAQEVIKFNISKWTEMDARLEKIQKSQEHDRLTLAAICEHQLKLEELINATRTDIRSAATIPGDTPGSGSNSGTSKHTGRRRN